MSFQVRREQIFAMRRDRYAEQLSSVFKANGGRASSDPSNSDLLLTDAVGRITRVAVATNGLPRSATTPEGRTFGSEIGDDGQLRGFTNSAGYHVGLEYDPDGRISALSAEGREVWRLRYEQSGRVADIGYADSTMVRFHYGGATEGLAVTNRLGHSEILGFEGSRLVSLVDGNGNKTRFEYGAWDRPDRAILSDGSVEAYTYDQEGYVAGIQWGTSALVELKNNPAGKPLHLLYGDGQTLRFSYDDEGNPIAAMSGDLEVRFRWSQAGRLVEESQEGSSVRYAYDSAGNLASLTYPGGSVVRFEYDKDDRVVSVADWSGGRYTYRYFSEDRGYIQNSPGGLTATVAMSPGGLPTSMGIEGPTGRRLFATSFTYDDNLRAISTQDSERGMRQFRYDAEGQLLSVCGSDGTAYERFAYDAAGNRVESNGELASFDALNQLLTQGESASTYDGRGNAIGCVARGGKWAFRWDQRNLLVAADGPGGERLTFGYDAFGRRIWKREEARAGRPVTTTRFLWAGEQLITIIIQRGSTVKRQDFLYLPGTLVPVATRIDGRVYTYHCDNRGAPTRLTDEHGKVVWAATYDAFGEAALHQCDVENPLRLPGQWEDSETGLHYNRFRYYSPILGRYLSRDPLSFVAGPNLYTYVGNDPINRTDPLGLWWKALLSVIAGVAAAAIVVVTAPISLPMLALGAAAVAMGVGVGLGVNKMLNLKEPNPAQLGKAFAVGFGMGLAITALAVGIIASLPAAAAATVGTALVVGASGVGTVAMCSEHFGLNLMPWEGNCVPFSEMTPEQQNDSTGNLLGGLAAGGLAGKGIGPGGSLGLPSVKLPSFKLPSFEFAIAAAGGGRGVIIARPTTLVFPETIVVPATTIVVPAQAAAGAVAAGPMAPIMMSMSGGGGGGGGGDEEKPPETKPAGTPKPTQSEGGPPPDSKPTDTPPAKPTSKEPSKDDMWDQYLKDEAKAAKAEAKGKKEYYAIEDAAAAGLEEKLHYEMKDGKKLSPNDKGYQAPCTDRKVIGEVKSSKVREDLKKLGHDPNDFRAVQYDAKTEDGTIVKITVFESVNGQKVFFGAHVSKGELN